MTFDLKFTPKAEEHMAIWQKCGQRKTLLKIYSIFAELKEHPTTGTGHPEQLKGDKHGRWSRRIDKDSRMVYSIDAGIVTVTVMSLCGHYDDK